MRLKLVALALLLASCTMLTAQPGGVRSQIMGVSHIAIYTSDPVATEHFYTVTVGALKMPDPENPNGVIYMVGDKQWVEVLPKPADAGINRLDHVAFTIGWPGVEMLRRYLKGKGWAVPAKVTKGANNNN